MSQPSNQPTNQPTNQPSLSCYRLRTFVWIILAGLSVTPSFAGTASDFEVSKQKALEFLSNRLTVSTPHLKVVAQIEADGIRSFKVFNQRTRNVETIELGLDNQEATPVMLKRAHDAKVARSFTGKIHNSLKATLNNLKPNSTDEVDVVVWAKMGYALPSYDWDTLAQQGRKHVEETERFALTVAASLHTKATNPILDLAFKQGWKIGYQSELAPILTLKLPANQVKMLESRSDVIAIYPDEKIELALDTSATEVGARGVGGVWERGVTGSGVSVAVVEPDAIFFGHPNLQDGTNTNTLTDSPIGNHATHVAGIIASTHNTYRGIAFGAPALISANFSPTAGGTQSLYQATEIAIANGAKILNYSVGANSNINDLSNHQLTIGDAYIDYITEHHRRLAVVAAGNSDLCTTNALYVTSPGKAYSAITVGNYNHHANAISPSSCFGNPTSGTEKPEVAAPGTDIYSTVTSNLLFDKLTGTSMAAPHVSGCAALLMQRKPNLQNQPEAIKAVLMASAIRNIEGDKTLSDKDGVGAIVCDAADDILLAGGEAHQVVTAAQVSGGYTYPYPTWFWSSDTHSFYATAGQSVRVVTTWGSHVNTGASVINGLFIATADNLTADFDLHVSGPEQFGSDGAWCDGCHHPSDVGGNGSTGYFYQGSYSINNPYEIVEFVAPVTGTYTIWARQNRFQGASENLAFAWWIGQRRN